LSGCFAYPSPQGFHVLRMGFYAKLHKDEELFEKTVGYVREYY
jgi:hypothetical protein